MMESFALAKAIELQNRAREEEWRRNEDLFYIDNARDPSPLLVWLLQMLAAMRGHGAATKKADRLETSQSACDRKDCFPQAACSRM